MFILKVILLPFSFLYGLVVALRNILFDVGVLKSKSYAFPIISVGNITVGGTGKSPHVEYLIRLLKGQYKLATLSRGYGRKTKGHVYAKDRSDYLAIGDEPAQFYKKFPEVIVAVNESRREGIDLLMDQDNELDLVLLDDAYQHRYVTPGLNILLVRYADIGDKQFMLPSGQLREWRRGKKRADVIVVSKSPDVLSPIEARRITDILDPEPYQKVFFSYVSYLPLEAFNDCAVKLEGNEGFSLSDYKVLLTCGIANSSSLALHLKQQCKELTLSDYGDHHNYTVADVLRINNEYDALLFSKKIIITTEKDSMRLRDPRLYPLLKDIPVFVLPIEVKVHHNGDGFDELIKDYVRRNKRSK